jgi:hypothetical protein
MARAVSRGECSILDPMELGLSIRPILVEGCSKSPTIRELIHRDASPFSITPQNDYRGIRIDDCRADGGFLIWQHDYGHAAACLES